MFNPPDEDGFFAPIQSGSKLSELFDVASTNTSGNTDLTYVAPKQPKRTKEKLLPKINASLLFAKVVHVQKNVNDIYKTIGKYGLALVGFPTHVTEIMLYKDKRNILTKITLTEEFSTSLDDDDEYIDNKNVYPIYFENDHLSFNTKDKQKWQVQFEEEKSLSEFLQLIKKMDNIKIIEVVKEKTVIDSSTSIVDENTSVKNDGSESDESSVSQTRADILSRMAKMGQSILPGNLKSGIDIDPTSKANRKISVDSRISDSSKEILDSSLPSEITKTNNIPHVITQPYLVNNNHSAQISPFVPIYTSNGLPNTALVNAVIPSQEFNLFVSENRIQNSEVRMNLTTISSKLDSVLNEISKIKEPPNTDKLENEFLKSKIVDLERNISDLSEKLQKASNLISHLEISIKDKDRQIQDEKKLFIELQSSLKEAEKLQIEVDNITLKENGLNDEINNLKQQLRISEESIQENQMKYLTLQETNENLMKINKDLSEEVKLLGNKNKPNEDLNQKVKNFSDIIKDSMNLMYQNIMGQIDKCNEPLQQAQIKAILSSNVKQATFGVIQKFQTFLQSSESVVDGTESAGT